jgi:hypothetical protein
MEDEEPSEEQAEATDAGKPLIEQGAANLLGHNAQVHLHTLQRENKAEA